jgi:acyl-homoserine-lactone acylase
MGAFNAIQAPFAGSEGYPEVESGSSFIMAVEFTERGPRSRALVTYSQSADPTSPHAADQTRLYSRKEWVELPFREPDVLADPALRSYRVVQRP